MSTITAESVIEAILAVGREAARRSEMFPQTSDEQLEDRRAVSRVIGMLRWYEKNTGCARIKGWPGSDDNNDLMAAERFILAQASRGHTR